MPKTGLLIRGQWDVSTRKYLLHPPLDYTGEHMMYECDWKLKHTNDPIKVLSAFIDRVLAGA